MLMVSISAGSADATPQETAALVMLTYKRSRSSAVVVFESQTRGTYRSGFSTTAAATTGPARQPRPTSSTPATWLKPMRRKLFSSVLNARTFTMAMPTDRLGEEDALRGLLPLLFLHPRCLALQVAQEVQLRAADACGADHVDLVD